MTRYIDKDALVAEIEKRQRMLDLDNPLGRGGVVELEYLKNTLNTLEVKEVDLAKEYDNEFFKDPVFGKLVNRNAGIGIAKHFYSLGLAQKGE